jgi:hypothetical protein
VKFRAGPTCPRCRTVLRAVRDAARRWRGGLRPSLTAPARDASGQGRSALGNGPDSLTRKSLLATPLRRQTQQERAATSCAT